MSDSGGRLTVAQANAAYLGAQAPTGITAATATYDHRTNLYNTALVPSALRRSRVKRGAATAGAGLFRLACLGDSTTAGLGAARGSTDYPFQLRGLLKAFGLPVGGTGYVWAGCAVPDSRWTLGAGWVSTTIGGASFAQCVSTNGAVLTFTSDVAGTTVQFWYGNNSGTFTYAIDGGAAVPVAPSGATAMASVTVGSLANTTHTLVITTTSTASVFAFGAEVRGASGVLVSNFAETGASSSDWDLTGSYFNYRPQMLAYGNADLYVVNLGINDWLQNRGAAAFQTDLTTLVTTLQALPADVCLVVPTPSDPAASAGVAWQPYQQAVYAVADAKGCPVLDLTDRWASFAVANPLGYFFDNKHPLPAGYGDIAQAVQRLIAA